MYTASDHTFAICAYKENPFLRETIASVLAQNVKSSVILSTSTPNDYVKGICEEYGIKMVVNPKPHLAGDDWNYAYDSADTPLVTIVHQDDYYDPTFLEVVLDYLNRAGGDDTLIAYTDYFELRGGKRVYDNKILSVKRKMNAPLRWKGMARARWIRRRILGFGDPICCPAVTYVKPNCGDSVFDTTLINSCDYKTYVDLATREGAFIYIPHALMGHRIYAGSATTKNIGENIRKGEDEQILGTLWPAPIAHLINSVYATSEKSNEL